MERWGKHRDDSVQQHEVSSVYDDSIYLDYNATTPVDPRVRERMMPFLSDVFGNPSSSHHSFGRKAADAVEQARHHVAELVHASPHEICFTSCATESINQALKGLAYSRQAVGKTIITIAAEHKAVLATCRQLEDHVRAVYLPVTRSCGIDLNELSRRVPSAQTLLVSVMWANNETGTVYPVREAADIAHRAGALFFTDATQAVGKIPVDVRESGVDLMAFSAHKLYGPKGVGALFVRGGPSAITLQPLLSGGGQEQGLRGGTLNVAGIVGFGEACRIAKTEMNEEASRVSRLRHLLEEHLRSLPNVIVNGDRQHRLPNTSSLRFLGVEAPNLIREMGSVAVSTGSACASQTGSPSHVLKAIGLCDACDRASVRFSLGRFTTEQEIATTIRRVTAAVQRLRAANRPPLAHSNTTPHAAHAR